MSEGSYEQNTPVTVLQSVLIDWQHLHIIFVRTAMRSKSKGVQIVLDQSKR